jgi:hypothetical protein
MSEAHPNGCAGGEIGSECGRSTALRASDWLGLAASPTFAGMALLSVLSGSQPDVLCSATQHASPLNGMVAMYVLMSAFHLAPWLKLLRGPLDPQRRGPRVG